MSPKISKELAIQRLEKVREELLALAEEYVKNGK